MSETAAPMPTRMLVLRRVLLAGTALVFGSIALLALVAPRAVAARYAYHLDSPASFNEFRAVFVGFWSGLALLFGTAARRLELTLLGDLAGALLVLQALGRVLSIALDGVPAPEFLAALPLELLTGLAIVLLPRLGSRK